MVTKMKKKGDNNKNKSKYKKSTNVLFNFCKPDWYKVMFHYYFITLIFASLTTSEFEHFCFHVYRTGTPALLRISLCVPCLFFCCAVFCQFVRVPCIVGVNPLSSVLQTFARSAIRLLTKYVLPCKSV